jgi:hypothetical protein
MGRQDVSVRRSMGTSLAFGAILVASLGACSSHGEPFVPSLSTTKIVATYAESAVEVRLERENPVHRSALEAFLGKTAAAGTRADLVRAWNEVPVLHALGANVLETKVFAQAEADADWPREPIPPSAEKSVYVEGVRAGVKAFLTGGGH